MKVQKMRSAFCTQTAQGFVVVRRIYRVIQTDGQTATVRLDGAKWMPRMDQRPELPGSAEFREAA